MSQSHLDNHSSAQQIQMHFNPFPQASTTNYAGIVASVLIQFGMNPLQSAMADSSNLQKTQTDMSCKYTNLSELLTSLEGQGMANGVAPSTASIQEFVEQFKSIYCSDGQNPTYTNLPPIFFHGQNLSSVPGLMDAFWAHVQGETTSIDSKSWIFQQAGNSSTLPVSDLQMYVLWKLQTKLDTLPAGTTIGSVTDLLNAYDPNPASGSSASPDPVVSGALNLLNSSNMGQTIAGTGRTLLADVVADLDPWDPLNLSDDFVALEEGYYNHTHDTTNAPTDQLSPIATQVSTTQTVLGAQSQQVATMVQQDISEITSYDNTGQNIIQNAASDVSNTVKNIG